MLAVFPTGAAPVSKQQTKSERRPTLLQDENLRRLYPWLTSSTSTRDDQETNTKISAAPTLTNRTTAGTENVCIFSLTRRLSYDKGPASRPAGEQQTRNKKHGKTRSRKTKGTRWKEFAVNNTPLHGSGHTRRLFVLPKTNRTHHIPQLFCPLRF